MTTKLDAWLATPDGPLTDANADLAIAAHTDDSGYENPFYPRKKTPQCRTLFSPLSNFMADPGNVGDVDPPLTSVHTLESNGGLVVEQARKPLIDPLTGHVNEEYEAPAYVSTCFRHSGWHRERHRVYDALNRTQRSVSRRLAFARCGSTYHVLRSKTDPTQHRLAAKACHDRFCKVCGGERSRLIAVNVKAFLKGHPCRFVTLTLRNNGQSLQVQLDRLYKGFQALRKSIVWKKTQRGGVAFLEVKRSSKTGLWHPHMHVLTQGSFIPQAKLSQTWLAITGDSHVVDVRCVKDEAHAVAYVAKYASKPMDPSTLDNDEHLDETVLALEGRRLVTTFGKWRGLKVTSKPDKDAWEIAGTLDEFADRAVAGDATAERIVRSLTGEWADRWLTASRRRTGARPRADDVDLHQLSFADMDAIPF